jgi:hypothetical protein
MGNKRVFNYIILKRIPKLFFAKITRLFCILKISASTFLHFSWLANIKSPPMKKQTLVSQMRHTLPIVVLEKLIIQYFLLRNSKLPFRCYNFFLLSSIPVLFSAWLSISFENHSLNSSCESNKVGIMKCSNAHNSAIEF